MRKLIWDRGQKDRRGYRIAKSQTPAVSIEKLLGDDYSKDSLDLPEVSELDVVRHFTFLAHHNFSVDSNFYPLGSCTMKYNPKINDVASNMAGFRDVHPLAIEALQGSLEVMYQTQEYLCKISGMDAVTLQPLAGAHGELTGLMLIQAYHRDHGENRDEVIIPDSAHGTNPASAAMCGYKVVEVKSKDGMVDVKELRKKVSNKTAALMLTNPNTLGLFEKDICEIEKIVHDAGGLIYYDGANLNALMGIATPGDMGFDVMHFNLHKTFSTPHGGGGPGSGPVGVKKILEPYLPKPVIVKKEHKVLLDYDRDRSIGKVASFYGNFGVVLRAFVYMTVLGKKGLEDASQMAVLNANYLKVLLEDVLDIPYSQGAMHEFVASSHHQELTALEIAKALLDYGYHAPTVYFPLIVSEALMIEPTETESPETLEEFAKTLKEILKNLETSKNAPHMMFIKRTDEVKAARHPILTRAQMLENK
ncbi:MAG: aminomethyl-transferring glycine dehydrogenase subunit GcvPB [Firmicutes bacterium]|nr:aminomethyl-transferring glycine dehydrogenase subunit GcvPB [Bacillota bacterium]MDD4693935.1 aminomethyl-transferring glycine dehydrogenase subunit GcvPB [Bacillota bacterium]